MSDHRSFSRFLVNLRGQELVVIGKPGVWSWDRLNPGTAALLELPRFDPDAAVLDLGCGTGIIGAVAGRLAPRGDVTLVDCNLVAVSCARRTLEANAVASVGVRLADGVEGLDQASFDMVLCHLPRGREVQRELIRGVGRVLRPGGCFYFVASTKAGIKGAVAYARDLFGRCGVVQRKKSYHVAMTVRPAGMTPPEPEDSYTTRTITLDEVETSLVSKPGVFAWDRLDRGTEHLVGAMEIDRSDRVLDLGCGTGLAGVAAARRAPGGEVVLVDADLRAVRSARRTLQANSVDNGKVLLSDGASRVVNWGPFDKLRAGSFDKLRAGSFDKLRAGSFDVVICNPPFHLGREVDYRVAHQFVRDSREVLRPGGRLFLVSNRFIDYEDLIRELFGQVATVWADPSYHVLMAKASGGAA